MQKNIGNDILVAYTKYCNLSNQQALLTLITLYLYSSGNCSFQLG